MAAPPAQPQARPLRQPPQAVRYLRLLQGARHRRVRRGDVRTGSGARAASVPGFAVSSRWSERPRPRAVQPAGSGGRPSAHAAPAGATSDGLPLGELRPATQRPGATARAGVGARLGDLLAPGYAPLG